MTATEAAAPESGDQGRRSWLADRGLSPWDGAGLALALLLVVAFAPPLVFEGWTMRGALLLAAGPVGLVLLTRRIAGRDVTATLLGAALLWTVLAAFVSGGTRSALLGTAGRDLSAWTVVCASGTWALGCQMSERGREWLADVVTAATSVGAVVGIAQVLADVTTGPLALAAGRPTGLVTNPVYYGALCAAGLVLAVARWVDRPWRWSAPAVLLLGVGTSLSGSRVALLAGIVGLLVLGVLRRARPVSVGIGFAALALGVLLDRTAGAGRNAADRIVEGAGGGRLTVWRYGVDAWLDRPLHGYGFGRFRPAVQDRFSVAFVRDHAADDVTQAWFDAHNVGVGLLVAVGVVGAALFVAWAVRCTLSLRHPVAWALLPLVFHWLLQPVSLFTLPLAMLVLGAAGVAGESDVALPRGLVAGAISLGLVLALGLLASDLALKFALDDRDGDRAATAPSLFWRDAVVDDLVAQAMAVDQRQDDPAAAELEWRRHAAEHEPDRPYWWSLLARRQIDAGRLDAAEESLDHAYELQEHNVRTIRAEGFLALERRDEDRLQSALDRLCELGQPECEVTASELLARTAVADEG